MRWLLLFALVFLVVLAQMLLPSAASAPRNQHANLPSPTIAKAKQAPRLADSSQQVQTVTSDTTWFGGTQWDAADQRWEALQDSIWTFETGVASAIVGDLAGVYPGANPNKEASLHAIMEGWIGFDNTFSEVTYFRRLASTDSRWGANVCVGSAAGLGGTYSLWCGAFPDEANAQCFASGQGYGNSWVLCIGQTFGYTGGGMNISFDTVVETESGYDFATVEIDTSCSGGACAGDIVEVVAYHGIVIGTQNLSLSPGLELPIVSSGEIQIRFCFGSDGAWSDQDSLNATACGAFAVDNISISGGGIAHSTTFETGDDGWLLLPAVPGAGGEWSDIQAVSDLPTVAGSDSCSLGDSVLTFVEGRPPSAYHSCWHNNRAVSPWIDLAEASLVGSTGFIVEYDGFFYLPLIDYHFLAVEVQWYPETCPYTGNNILSEITSTGFVFAFPEPSCSVEDGPQRVNFTDIIPPYAERVRLAVGVVNYNNIFLCESLSGQNTTPWFDNIRFGVFDTTGVAIGISDDPKVPSAPRLGHFSPNPYRGTGRGRLTFTLPREGRARVDIFDIAGRLVKTVFDNEASPGSNTIYWDGIDLSGRRIPSGVYFYRLLAGGKSISRKMVVIHN